MKHYSPLPFSVKIERIRNKISREVKEIRSCLAISIVGCVLILITLLIGLIVTI